MKKTFILCLVITLIFISFLPAQPVEHSYKPKNGYVSDSVIAIKIAEAVLVSIYGERVINEEKPLKAELKKGIWIVKGTLNCPDGNTCRGGVAVIEISKDDGTILRVSHGK